MPIYPARKAKQWQRANSKDIKGERVAHFFALKTAGMVYSEQAMVLSFSIRERGVTSL